MVSPALTELLDTPTLPEAFQIIQRRLDHERERRDIFYAEVTPDMKAEFINGEVIMHSPALARHTATRRNLTALLNPFVISRDLGIVHDEKTLCVFPRNDYEPDVVFFGPTKAATITPDTMKFPPPDFACEVLSESTEKRDRGVKFQDYQAHGVAEYWIIDPVAQHVEQFVLDAAGCYSLRQKSSSGDFTSTVIPGFTIPVDAIFDEKRNLEALRRILG
ncbi:MAG: Uma2 family endonuclease [Prosthecobacter sp.]|uniref:Uma2 family endonuclease n=1 Tax=Prosthecobacter sp. TaxID=1965333 RepID=UPI003901F513